MLKNTNINMEYLFEQYKIAIDTTDKTSDRRYQFNRFIITIATVLVAFSDKLTSNNIINIFILFAGLGLCCVWLVQLKTADKLVSIKHKTLYNMEKMLNIYPTYTMEYVEICDARNKKEMNKNSYQEKFIALIFLSLFALILSIKIILLIKI